MKTQDAMIQDNQVVLEVLATHLMLARVELFTKNLQHIRNDITTHPEIRYS